MIFGEVLPQSVCVRYGLAIGGYMSKPVLALMYFLAPLAWPTAKLLDWLLGEDHGTVYKKSGLKTLVTLHKSLGDVSQRLNQDEVTIISAVLDLKEKPVANVMTPMDDVFVMAEDTVLDEPTMDMILSAGYSRIPIHETGNPTNFVGMLLVKILITYDPEDCSLVRDFPLATLPETRPETSCLDIVNFFQEGKSHMVLVSEFPGEDNGALGVVTLEDVIEELIGEYVRRPLALGEQSVLTSRREIIDESDVYIDVHKAIRRLTPAPKARVQRRFSEDPQGKISGLTRCDSDSALLDVPSATPAAAATTSSDPAVLSSSPKTATLMMRRSSAGIDGQFLRTAVPVRTNIDDIKQHLKHLGPSNPATNPNKTRSTTVKVKPGSGIHAAHPRSASVTEPGMEELVMEEGDETTSLLKPHTVAKDGVQAVGQTYGSISPAITVQLAPQSNGVSTLRLDSEEHITQPTLTSGHSSQADLASTESVTPTQQQQASPPQQQQPSQQLRNSSSGESASSMKTDNTLVAKPLPFVRSGSITENVVESRGVRKVVLQTADSKSEEPAAATSPEQPRRSAFGLFSAGGRESKDGKDGKEGEVQTKGPGKRPAPEEEVEDQKSSQQQEEEEDEDEDLLSPIPGDEEAPSYAEATAKGTAQEGQAGPSSGGGGGAKKKNRRKKRKGGKS